MSKKFNMALREHKYYFQVFFNTMNAKSKMCFINTCYYFQSKIKINQFNFQWKTIFHTKFQLFLNLLSSLFWKTIDHLSTFIVVNSEEEYTITARQ